MGASKPDPELEEIRTAIKKVSQVGAKLTKSGLTERAIILLLHDLTGVNKRDIKTILENIGNLKAVYLNESEQ